MPLPRFVAPLTTASLTLGATLLLRSAQENAAEELKRQASEVREFDLFNPLTYGNVFTNIKEIPEALAAFIALQVITGVMYIVVIGGSLLTGYFVWVNYFGGPRVLETAERVARLTPTGQVAGAAQEVATTVAGNPHFDRGTRARAVRDLLAKRIQKAEAAKIPEKQIKKEMKRSARGT